MIFGGFFLLLEVYTHMCIRNAEESHVLYA